MFGGNWSCGSGDMTNVVCRVTSKDHFIEGSYDVDGSSSYVTTLPILVAMGIVLVEICFEFVT